MNEALLNPRIDHIKSDRKIRQELAKESHYWFFHLYFSMYVKYETAPFQKEMFLLTEDENLKMAVIVAFRGSAKSTIMTLSYPIWAVIGKQQKKFVLLLSQTQSQARQHLINLKRELESNELLRADLGPFEYQSDEWGITALVLPKYGAKIMAASSETSIRGIKHGQHRPDLIICDDVEDLNSVKTLEGRDKVEQWLTGEVIPMGEKSTKLIIVGNLLHEDSLLMRLKNRIESGRAPGKFLSVPLVSENGTIAWPGRYGSLQEIEELRRLIGNEVSWQREFMLKIISTEGQLIHQEAFHYYQEVPSRQMQEYRFVAHGVDLANSTKTHADCTAIVTAYVFGTGVNLKIYIAANPVNRKMEFPQAIEQIKLIHDTLGGNIYIESVAYQGAMIQQLKKEHYPAFPVTPGGQEKWMRAIGITPLIQDGTILFPEQGCEDLIRQLVGFGVERHDDLVDALVYLVLEIVKRNHAKCRAFEFKPDGF